MLRGKNSIHDGNKIYKISKNKLRREWARFSPKNIKDPNKYRDKTGSLSEKIQSWKYVSSPEMSVLYKFSLTPVKIHDYFLNLKLIQILHAQEEPIIFLSENNEMRICFTRYQNQLLCLKVGKCSEWGHVKRKKKPARGAHGQIWSINPLTKNVINVERRELSFRVEGQVMKAEGITSLEKSPFSNNSAKKKSKGC